MTGSWRSSWFPPGGHPAVRSREQKVRSPKRRRIFSILLPNPKHLESPESQQLLGKSRPDQREHHLSNPRSPIQSFSWLPIPKTRKELSSSQLQLQIFPAPQHPPPSPNQTRVVAALPPTNTLLILPCPHPNLPHYLEGKLVGNLLDQVYVVVHHQKTAIVTRS